MNLAVLAAQPHFGLLDINLGIWNLVLRFSHLPVDSGGIISSGMYFPNPARTLQTFLEFATSSGTYSSAVVITLEISLRGANLSTHLIVKEISLFGILLSKKLRPKSSSLSGAYLSTNLTKRRNPLLARDLVTRSIVAIFPRNIVFSLAKIL
jgi:hypothetical protein